jgi:hypothetical protein
LQPWPESASKAFQRHPGVVQAAPAHPIFQVKFPKDYGGRAGINENEALEKD